MSLNPFKRKLSKEEQLLIHVYRNSSEQERFEIQKKITNMLRRQSDQLSIESSQEFKHEMNK